MNGKHAGIVKLILRNGESVVGQHRYVSKLERKRIFATIEKILGDDMKNYWLQVYPKPYYSKEKTKLFRPDNE